jgi:DNA-binding transcriptional LysR family regulator
MAELTVVGMRVVNEVAARGSFTAAAAALGYTQSAVSRQVALMEDAVGARLFERMARGVRLTAPGAVLLRHIAAVLDRIDAAELELKGLRDGLEGRLTLGAFPTALNALVPRALARLTGEHPAVQIRLREGGTLAQLRRVRARRIQVAVVAAGGGLEYELGDLLADRLLEGGPQLAVAEGHRFAQRGWVSVGELGDEPWIVGEADDSGPQFGPWPTLGGTPTIAYSVREWPARLGLVAAGLGIAVVPTLISDTLPPGIRLITVDDPRPLRREVLAVTLPERSPGVDALISALRVEGAVIASRAHGSPRVTTSAIPVRDDAT